MKGGFPFQSSFLDLIFWIVMMMIVAGTIVLALYLTGKLSVSPTRTATPTTYTPATGNVSNLPRLYGDISDAVLAYENTQINWTIGVIDCPAQSADSTQFYKIKTWAEGVGYMSEPTFNLIYCYSGGAVDTITYVDFPQNFIKTKGS